MASGSPDRRKVNKTKEENPALNREKEKWAAVVQFMAPHQSKGCSAEARPRVQACIPRVSEISTVKKNDIYSPFFKLSIVFLLQDMNTQHF